MNLRLCRCRRGLTLIELLVVIGILGVVTGASLVAMQSSREHARGIACMNHLREIGQAMSSYQLSQGRFPAGCTDYRPFGNKTKRHLGWCVSLLPHLEQTALYRQLDLSKAFNAPANAQAASTVLEIFLCPSSTRSNLHPKGRAACDYGGVLGQNINVPSGSLNGMLIYDKTPAGKIIPPVTVADVKDGLAHTLIVSENYAYDLGQWISGDNLNEQRVAINTAPIAENDIRSNHPGGAYGLFCDGHVRFLSETMDLNVLAAICTRAGNERVDYSSLKD